MYFVNCKNIYRNDVTYSYPTLYTAVDINEALSFISMEMSNKSNEYKVFTVSSEYCEFEFAIILAQNEFYVCFGSMGTQVYDYSHSDEAIAYIKIFSQLMGYDSFEEVE